MGSWEHGSLAELGNTLGTWEHLFRVRIRIRNSLECATLSWALLQFTNHAVYDGPKLGRTTSPGTSTSPASQAFCKPPSGGLLLIYIAVPPDHPGRAKALRQEGVDAEGAKYGDFRSADGERVVRRASLRILVLEVFGLCCHGAGGEHGGEAGCTPIYAKVKNSIVGGAGIGTPISRLSAREPNH